MAELLDEEDEEYLLLDSGDFSNGTAEAKRSEGLKSVDLMNKLGYNAATVGNHEFDFKDKGVEPILKKAEFPILAANFFNKKTKQHPVNVKPFHIFEVDDVKVAVIGIANQNPTRKSSLYSLTKPLPALEKALKEVEAKGAQVVLVLVHDSLQDDKHGVMPYVGDIGRKYSGRVHVVLGGHAHKIFQDEYIKQVLFVESGCYLKNVSKVTVTTDDKTGKFVSAKSELIPLDIAKIGQDEEMLAYAESLKEPGMDQVFGVHSFKVMLNKLFKIMHVPYTRRYEYQYESYRLR